MKRFIGKVVSYIADILRGWCYEAAALGPSWVSDEANAEGLIFYEQEGHLVLHIPSREDAAMLYIETNGWPIFSGRPNREGLHDLGPPKSWTAYYARLVEIRDGRLVSSQATIRFWRPMLGSPGFGKVEKLNPDPKVETLPPQFYRDESEPLPEPCGNCAGTSTAISVSGMPIPVVDYSRTHGFSTKLFERRGFSCHSCGNKWSETLDRNIRGGKYTKESWTQIVLERYWHGTSEEALVQMLRGLDGAIAPEAIQSLIWDGLAWLVPAYRSLESKLLERESIFVSKILQKEASDKSICLLTTGRHFYYCRITARDILEMLRVWRGMVVADDLNIFEYLRDGLRSSPGISVVLGLGYVESELSAVKRQLSWEDDKVRRLLSEIAREDRDCGPFPGDSTVRSRRSQCRRGLGARVDELLAWSQRRPDDESLSSLAECLKKEWFSFRQFVNNVEVPYGREAFGENSASWIKNSAKNSSNDREWEMAIVICSLLETALRFGLKPDEFLIDLARLDSKRKAQEYPWSNQDRI